MTLAPSLLLHFFSLPFAVRWTRPFLNTARAVPIVVASLFFHLNRISIPHARPSSFIAPRVTPSGVAAAMKMDTAPERDKEWYRIHRWSKCCETCSKHTRLCQTRRPRISEGDRGDSPQSRAGRPSEELVWIGQGQVRRVSDLSRSAFKHANVAIECTIQCATGNMSTVDSSGSEAASRT